MGIMFCCPKRLTERGIISPHLFIALAIIGLILYVLISSTFPFKDKLFGLLYSKPSSQAATSCQKMLLPAYFYPSTSQALWDKVIADASSMGFIIADPANGPGTFVDQNYVSVLSKVKNANIKVLGYVDTNYGNRDTVITKKMF